MQKKSSLHACMSLPARRTRFPHHPPPTSLSGRRSSFPSRRRRTDGSDRRRPPVRSGNPSTAPSTGLPGNRTRQASRANLDRKMALRRRDLSGRERNHSPGWPPEGTAPGSSPWAGHAAPNGGRRQRSSTGLAGMVQITCWPVPQSPAEGLSGARTRVQWNKVPPRGFEPLSLA